MKNGKKDKNRNLKAWMAGILRSRRGTVLMITMAFVGLMVLSTLALSGMIKQNTELIRRVKFNAQAQYMAESGINLAFARFKNENFGSRSNFSGNLDTGSYSVTFSQTGGRFLITSVGTVGDISKTVSAEVEDRTPTAMRCICSADNDIRINSFVADADINGDIHANRDVYLKSGPLIASLTVVGTVSATGEVKEGSRVHVTDGLLGGFLDYHVYINGVNEDNAAVLEGEPRKRLPKFDYDKYREEAVDGGDYYDTGQTFNNQTLSPANGIIFVDGNASILGNCTLNGGIVADSITIFGRLTQNRAGTRNVVISRINDISILGKFETQEAVVYAGRDILSLAVGADIDINGVMLAKRDIYMWNFLTYIDYNYLETYPSDMGDADDQLFGVVSWNR